MSQVGGAGQGGVGMGRCRRRSFGILAPCVTSSSLCTDSVSTQISSSSLLSGSSTPRVDSMSDPVVSAPRVFQRQSLLSSLGVFGGTCICVNLSGQRFCWEGG